MNQTQKVIKYVAIAFGLFLAINIISAIVFGILGAASISFLGDTLFSTNSTTYVDDTYEIYGEVRELKIDLDISEFEIRTAYDFSLEVSNVSDRFEMINNNGILRIKDAVSNRWFNVGDKKSTIILYIPEEYVFDKIEIKTGVGTTRIEELNTKSLKLEIGMGSAIIDNINVTNSTTIKGGVGKVDIGNAMFEDLDLSTGVGEFIIEAELLGNSRIDCGVGKTSLLLLSSLDEYKITTETGIGLVSINGNKASNNSIFGLGENVIKLHAGIGSVDIRTSDYF